jgi:hypothetical protein
MLMPVSTFTQLTNASLTLSLMRVDMHQVTIGLGLPTLPAPHGAGKAFAAYSAFSLARARTPLLIDASVPASGPPSGVSVALEAVNNQIIRFQVLPRTVIVAP